MNILEKIIRTKREEVGQRLTYMGADQIKPGKNDFRKPLDFLGALRKGGLSVIAEVKKASPSKGVIRVDFDPVQIAKSYARNGASCISVLTDEQYFQGHNDYLKAIRAEVSLPLLRKEFIIDPRQVRESYELGADAILLIAAVLEKKLLMDLSALAGEFGLTALVEVHTAEELEMALDCRSQLIGINNRNLSTFVTDLETSLHLKAKIPKEVVTVSESGIRNREDCRLLFRSGFDAILVGETLMKHPDPGQGIQLLVGDDLETEN